MSDIKKRIVFSVTEKNILTDLLLKYKSVIENKKSDATTIFSKQKAWDEIEEAFNSVAAHKVNIIFFMKISITFKAIILELNIIRRYILAN